jgi:hypothetical protein
MCYQIRRMMLQSFSKRSDTQMNYQDLWLHYLRHEGYKRCETSLQMHTNLQSILRATRIDLHSWLVQAQRRKIWCWTLSATIERKVRYTWQGVCGRNRRRHWRNRIHDDFDRIMSWSAHFLTNQSVASFRVLLVPHQLHCTLDTDITETLQSTFAFKISNTDTESGQGLRIQLNFQ